MRRSVFSLFLRSEKEFSQVGRSCPLCAGSLLRSPKDLTDFLLVLHITSIFYS